MSKKRKESRKSAYLKYSGIAFQLFALLLIAVLAGQKLDERLALKFNYFTLTFIALALVAFFWKLIRDLEKDK